MWNYYLFKILLFQNFINEIPKYPEKLEKNNTYIHHNTSTTVNIR